VDPDVRVETSELSIGELSGCSSSSKETVKLRAVPSPWFLMVSVQVTRSPGAAFNGFDTTDVMVRSVWSISAKSWSAELLVSDLSRTVSAESARNQYFSF